MAAPSDASLSSSVHLHLPGIHGIAAGLGLSGDLKDPRVVPKGTIWATAVGIVIYIAVAIKLWWSAPLEALATDEQYMENIALWGPIIPWDSRRQR